MKIKKNIAHAFISIFSLNYLIKKIEKSRLRVIL